MFPQYFILLNSFGVGSCSHYVAVGQSLEDVKEFGVYAEDLIELCEKIKSCDKKIEHFVKCELKKSPEKLKLKTTDKPYKRINKNAPEIKDFNQIAFQYFGGIDLMAIEGVSHRTVLAIMSEIGQDGFKKFLSSKEYVCWLRLAPNNKT